MVYPIKCSYAEPPIIFTVSAIAKEGGDVDVCIKTKRG